MTAPEAIVILSGFNLRNNADKHCPNCGQAIDWGDEN